jgi:hypothetical protein
MLLGAVLPSFACDDEGPGHPSSGGSSRGDAGGTNTATGECRRAPEGAPRLPAPTELSPDEVARAAAVMGSCLPDDGVARNASHFWLAHLSAPRLYTRYGAQVHCLANANCGCSAVEHCLGVTLGAPLEPCESGCVGSVFSGCDDEGRVTIDCGRVGLACEPAASCVDGQAVACLDGDPATCTSEGEVAYCDDDFRRIAPCQSAGLSCVGGKCVGGGEACADMGGSSEQPIPLLGLGCDGQQLSVCVGGRKATVSCAEQGPGFGCHSRDGLSFCGLAGECTPALGVTSATPTSCDENVLTFCNAGRLERIDCLALGFSGCELEPSQARLGCTPGLVLP